MSDRLDYPEPHYAPGWQPGPGSPAGPGAPPWDGVSIAAITTGALGLGPVAVALGGVGLARTRKGVRRGRVLAAIGLGLGVLAFFVYAALGGLVWLLLRPLPADVEDPRFALATQVSEGNCLASVPADGDVWIVRVVPCEDDHDATVVVRADLPNPPGGQTRRDEAAARLCREQAPEVAAGDLVVWSPTGDGATVFCLDTTT